VENIIKQHCRYDSSMSSSEQNTPAVEEYFQLDDFLRVEVHGTDSDPDVDASKDQEAGIRDIHLVDLRQWSKTLFMDIYGIPEVWLSLLSQTTRVANVIDLLEQTPTQASRGFTNSLQRRMNRLEHIICTFSAQQSSTLSQSLSQSNDSQIISATHKASLALLRAMSSALVILFYRRVRKVHPFILQSHVDDVIKALEEFDLAQGDADTGSLIPGTPWPAFIAGCEAISTPSRDRYIKWLQKGALHSAFNGFASSQQVMRRVWERRDTGNKAPEEVNMQIPSHNKGDVYSWVDVLREENFWLMLY
jgi:arginine metabolism regulation protein II